MQTTESQPAATPTASTPAQPLRLKESAIAQVKEIIRAQGFEGYYLSIRVAPAGCSGLGYDLNLVKEPQAGDVTWEQDGVKIVTDPMSQTYLDGTEVDYVSSIQGAGFKFLNPNAKSSCGCGSSFST